MFFLQCNITVAMINACRGSGEGEHLFLSAVAKRLGIGQPAVSIALARGEQLAKEKGFTLPERIK